MEEQLNQGEHKSQRRFVVMLYENQRWWLGMGYTQTLYKWERGPWSDLTGEMTLEKSDVKLLGKDWKWEGDWKIQGKQVLRQQADGGQIVFIDNKHQVKGMSKDIEGTYDEEGWQYAHDFTKAFCGREEPGDYVRRRKWIRVQVK